MEGTRATECSRTVRFKGAHRQLKPPSILGKVDERNVMQLSVVDSTSMAIDDPK
jgi:hypothetical protein